jgi:hypothetical protein
LGAGAGLGKTPERRSRETSRDETLGLALGQTKRRRGVVGGCPLGAGVRDAPKVVGARRGGGCGSSGRFVGGALGAGIGDAPKVAASEVDLRASDGRQLGQWPDLDGFMFLQPGWARVLLLLAGRWSERAMLGGIMDDLR